MKKNIFLLMLIGLVFQSYGQSNDFMPLSIGNSWSYQYYLYDYDQMGDFVILDTGTVIMQVVGQTTTPDSILWEFKESQDLVHHYEYDWPPFHDTSYAIHNTYQYEVVEYLQGNHRFFREGNENAGYVFNITQEFSDSTAFFRYQPQIVSDTFSFTRQHSNVLLGFNFIRGIGISYISYKELYVVGSTYVIHHTLQDAVITSVTKSGIQPTTNVITLLQNYPNPFNPVTIIPYQLSSQNRVTLTIFDNLGRTVATLVDGEMSAGLHTVVFDGSKYASGIYFYRVQTGLYNKAHGMLLLK